MPAPLQPTCWFLFAASGADSLWSSTEDNEGNKVMKHSQIFSSMAARKAVENLRFLRFLLLHKEGQTILARAIWLALPATRAVSTTNKTKKVS
jgi:hypothetical protein